jgi:S1-C subfamily serine protease
VSAQFRFLSGARAGQVDTFRKAYIGVGRHPLSDVRFDVELDLDVSARHASVIRHGEAFVLRDLGSTNGTFVNGQRIAGDVTLKDGDLIAFGQNGPALEFHVLPEEADAAATAAAADVARKTAERMSAARTPYPAVAARRPSTAVRIAAEVARQTHHLRRTTKLLIAVLVAALAAFGWVHWQSAADARELARLEARADSLAQQAEGLLARLETELASVRDALRQSQAEVGRLRDQLRVAGASADPDAVSRLRAELDAAEARQRGLAGAAAVDYHAISRQNQDAVALLIVAYSDSEGFSGTAFAVDSQGTLVTSKHVLVGEQGRRTPQRIAVKFSGSRQWFPGRLVGVAESTDVGVLRVDIRGGTPRVAGLARDGRPLERGDPVAIIGYPLGEDLPLERRGPTGAVADPTLTVGTVSKVLADLVQVDGYGAPGSSGSPIFDRQGHVAAVGGNRESQGKIIYAIPASRVIAYLDDLHPFP